MLRFLQIISTEILCLRSDLIVRLKAVTESLGMQDVVNRLIQSLAFPSWSEIMSNCIKNQWISDNVLDDDLMTIGRVTCLNAKFSIKHARISLHLVKKFLKLH